MPLFTAIGAALFGVGTFLAGATAFALQMAAGIGLNLIAAAIKGKPTQEKVGIQGKLTGGGDVPRSIILGEYNTAGSLVYRNTYGQSGETPNAFYVEVRALGDLPDGGMIDVWVDGEKVDLIAGTYGLTSTKHIKYGTKWGDLQHLWFQFYNGTQTTADSRLVSWFGGSDRPWSSDRIGKGVPYVIITALRDDLETENPLFNGFPNCKFTRAGVPLYDPSKDDTVGGSGSHRHDTPSTWGGDGDNLPAVQIYNILRGITYNGAWLYGLQAANPAILPPANWIAAINKCRAAVDGPDGLEAQYRSGAQIDVNIAPADAIEPLLKTCNGRLTEVGGVYTIHVGEPDTPVLSFSDADILSSDEQVYNPFRSLADSINGVVAKYPEPLEGWNVKTSPVTNNPAQIIRDGNRQLFADVDLSACPYHGQVQRLLKSAMLEALRERRHTIVLPPWAQALEPGDIVQWSSDRNGYIEKWFRIDGMAYKANLDVMLQITEVDPSDYDWNQSTDYVAPVFAPMEILRPAPQPMVSWNAEGLKETAPDGRQRVYVLLTWDGSKADINGVSYEIAKTASEDSIILRENNDNAGVGSIKVYSQGMLPGTTVYARGRYIPTSPRATDWSDWRPATLPDVRWSILDFNAALKAEINELNQKAEDAFNYSDALITSISDNQDSADWLSRDETRRQLKATAGDLSAAITHAETVAASATAALAETVDEVSATVGDNTAAITTTQTAVATIEGQLAVSYSVKLDVNGYIIGYQQTNGGPGTGTTIFTTDFFQIVGTGVSPKKPFTIGTVNGATSIGINADNVLIDASVKVRHLDVAELTAISAHFGDATVDGTLSGTDGKLVVGFSGSFIDIFD
ncbi:MAG: phage tail protein [Xanthobacteraceae bacterium]